MKRLLLFILLFNFTAKLHSQVLWDGEAGDGLWSTASNWSTNSVPGVSDNVILNNSLTSGSYVVTLPAGAITTTVSSLIITPSLPETIRLILPVANTNIPGLDITAPGDALVLNSNAILQNSSGASGGLPITVSNASGVFKINNGAVYIHNTARQHAGLIDKLSSVPGTEDGVFVFDVPGAAAYTVSIANRVFGHLIFSAVSAGTSKQYTGSTTGTLILNGDLDILSNAIFSYGANTNTINVKKNCNIFSGGTFNISNGANNSIVDLEGNLNLFGSITESGTSTGSIIRMIGGVTQTVTSTGSITNTVNMDINNVFGVTLLSTLQLPSDLQLSLGNFSIGNNDLTVTGSLIGGSTNSFIRTNGTGLLTLNGVTTTARIFPIGASTYNPLTISNPGASTNYSVRVEDGFPITIFDPARAVNRTWFIRGSITQQANVSFGYSVPSDVGTSFNTSERLEAGVRITDWSIYQNNIIPTGGPFYTAATTTNQLDAGSLRAFVLGNPTAILPIDFFITCNAQKQSGNALIKWSVAQTDNVISFEVERAGASNNYVTILNIVAVDSLLTYQFIDSALSKGVNYYRIKVNRRSGGIRYSNVAAIINETNDIFITSIIPNPVVLTAKVMISSDAATPLDFKVVDLSGKVVRRWQASLQSGTSIIECDFSNLPPGIYHIAGQTQKGNVVSRFVKH